MTFKTYEVIDASSGSASLRYRHMLRVRACGVTLHIPLSRWAPCTFQRGYSKRMSKYHCDMCEKYLDWSD